MALLDPSTIAQVENLAVSARIIVRDALTGMHRSALHGSSVEFSEHKEYAPGDEIRHIDWKAYAKVDRYYVKQFEQESQLTCYLVLDASGSMAYGAERDDDEPGSKLAYASRLLAALGYLLIRQRDKVGLFVYGDESLDPIYVPPRSRTGHFHSLLEVLVQTDQRGARGDESAASALERIAEMSRRKPALIVLASDLFEPSGAALEALRTLRAQRHDVALFHTLDHDEIEFPFDKLTLFESLEDTDRKLLVNAALVKKRYLEQMKAFRDEVRNECAAAGVEYHFVDTADSPEKILLEFLSARAGAKAQPRAWGS
jgi:uncharacterized protein (DUF58 family)